MVPKPWQSEAYKKVHAVIVTNGCSLEIFNDDNGTKNRYEGSKSLKHDHDEEGGEGIGHNKNTHFSCSCVSASGSGKWYLKID